MRRLALYVPFGAMLAMLVETVLHRFGIHTGLGGF